LHQCVQNSYFVCVDRWEVVPAVLFQQCFMIQCGHCYSISANVCEIRQVHAWVLCAAKFCQSTSAYICKVCRKKFIPMWVFWYGFPSHSFSDRRSSLRKVLFKILYVMWCVAKGVSCDKCLIIWMCCQRVSFHLRIWLWNVWSAYMVQTSLYIIFFVPCVQKNCYS
jgi:hypothetical protein